VPSVVRLSSRSRPYQAGYTQVLDTWGKNEGCALRGTSHGMASIHRRSNKWPCDDGNEIDKEPEKGEILRMGRDAY